MRILSIQDLHSPFMHPDAVAFLQTVRDRYRTDTTVCVGDELDSHGLSVHDHNPDLPSAGDEVSLGVERLAPLYRAFPRVRVCTSNHTSRHLRQALRAGIPARFMKEYREALEAPDGWQWANEWTLDGTLFLHGEHAANEMKALEAAFRFDLNTVQGHIHNKASIIRGKSRSRTRWACMGGCLIDFTSAAFDYARKGVMRPMLGAPVILDGDPLYVEMKVKANGRWVGHL
jgi:hypothetical protein